ncbi:uncharacterized protein LOC110466790 [Mizuhopecten yessoensis]|uniref:SBF1/SBF2 domain-containing protein n=1 Tax=Mizuhopecten yessoensis TaxID=6573 RepID=A0A210PNI1_MIZYE|nr:uncharacterized protein LOC110466790 [Mizuhopecten yessoensis]OWF38028.1 hypothetical protein KP79_PYT14346 [Mizuhopecten yessoensis]
MDFLRRRLSQGGSSDEEQRSSSSSISEGTSRFFSSVVAKKNGLLNNISSKIENVGARLTKSSSSSYDSSSGENSPTFLPTPPREKSKDLLFPEQDNYDTKSVTSIASTINPSVQIQYGRDRHDSSSGYSDSSGNADNHSLSNINMSFEEPLYSPTSKIPGETTEPRYDHQFIEKSANERNEKDNIQSNNGNNHQVVADVHVDQSNFIERQKVSPGHIKSPSSASVSSPDSGKSTPSENSRKNAPRQRAPKFTTTKRRSSTVDEMLFDDYVSPPEEVEQNDEAADQVGALVEPDSKSANRRSLIPLGDLMSFDDDQESEKDMLNNKQKIQPTNRDNTTHTEDVTNHRVSLDQSTCSVDSSDWGGYDQQTSVESSENDFGGYQVRHRTGSMGSENSWSSSYSIESQPDDITLECMSFMKQFVEKIFNISHSIAQTEKAKFGELCQFAPGRLWFARYVNSQRVHNKNVSEQIFFQLVQYFAVVLFECNEAEDFSPAKSLMNMCFTFFYESHHGNVSGRNFLYSFLREQPIWQSLRFWNAAFFDAVQCERARQPMCTSQGTDQAQTDDQEFQENITFGQLGTFTCNMRSFGLNKDLCLEFLRKQSTIANLKEEQVQMLRENVEKLRET